jgi:hypothetical protein
VHEYLTYPTVPTWSALPTRIAWDMATVSYDIRISLLTSVKQNPQNNTCRPFDGRMMWAQIHPRIGSSIQYRDSSIRHYPWKRLEITHAHDIYPMDASIRGDSPHPHPQPNLIRYRRAHLSSGNCRVCTMDVNPTSLPFSISLPFSDPFSDPITT